MRRLFISYSRDDKAWVSELYRALREDYDAWMDRRIIAAADWWETILAEIEGCDCFIYVMTPKSVESIYCRAEVEHALALNKPVLPLMLKSCTPPDSLSKRRVQFQTIDDRMSLERVTGIISRSLVNVVQEQVSGKYKPKVATRPAEPQANAQQIEETFRLAEEAAAQQNDSLAEKLFQQVILKDPQWWGKKAVEQLVALRSKTTPPISTKRSAPSKDNPHPRRESSRSRVHEMFPTLFGWIEVPAGKVTLVNMWDDNDKVYLKKNQPHEFKLPAFAIAKYPVTNAQFAKFIEAKGYQQQKWWTEGGWRAKEQGKWVEPLFWTNRKWHQADSPVVGISWYESIAFCRWLSDASSESILLPTEQQWQRAAQGDDGREYPWGSDWNASACNNNVGGKGIDHTTAVNLFDSKGSSPYGAVDMSGNVWEWCMTGYYSGVNEVESFDNRVQRGGAWDSNFPINFRTDFRYGKPPEERYYFNGFRICRS